MRTIAQAITEGAYRLHTANVREERRTAAVLLCKVLAIDRTQLLTRSEEPISDAQYCDYLALVDRRAAGEPLQYITGHQEFYGLDFIVTPDVLIPRPETEFLVERSVRLIEESRNATPLIVDIGTGSGCIAVSLAKQIPGARLIATDVSNAALEVAYANAERHGLRSRIDFLCGDLFSPLASLGVEGSVDLLASNPPYVNKGRPELVQREVRDWEPHAALFGGADGLEFYRRMLKEGAKYLKPDGHVVLEIGYSQLDSILEIIRSFRWVLVEVTTDLQGIPRTLTVSLK